MAKICNCGTGTCFDGDEVVVATTTTAADGSYSFNDVPDGDYLVEVTDVNNVLDGMEPTSGLDSQTVTTDSTIAGNPDPVDFGYVGDAQTGVITSGLWIDSDGDGVQDPDEAPVAGVSIDLVDCGADGLCGSADDVVVGTAVTDVDGNIIFDELPAGVYQLDVDESDPDLPANLTETNYIGIDPSAPSAPIALSEGESVDADFGYVPDAGTAIISGALWADVDADGLNESSELGLGGISVTLTNIATGVVITTTTNADGSYEFTGLTRCPTTDPCYSVMYDAAAINSLGLVGDEPTNTPDQNSLDGTTVPDGINDNIYLVNVESGEVADHHDFGFEAPMTAVGAVEGNIYYEPAPADGSLNGSDTGIELVTVNLVDAVTGDVVGTATTSDGFTDVDGDGVIDPAGYYSFEGVLPGDYQVVVTDVNNSTSGLNPSGDPDEIGLCVTCDQATTVTVTAGTTSTNNFGYMGEQTLGNIGNLVWFDVDNDGMYDPLAGDTGIAGVTVECWYDTDNDGIFAIDGIDNLIRSVTTDTNGEYYCEGLPIGSYFVKVTDSNGVLTGFTAATVIGGTGELTDIDNANKMDITDPDNAWYIETGSDNLTADFAVTGSNVISGNVFEETPNTIPDATFDGVNDSAAGGVTVIVLIEQPDGSFVELTRTTTLADGSYEFTGLPDGNYQIIVDTSGSSINGYGQTADPDLAAGTVCDSFNGCDATAGTGTPLSLAGGSTLTDINFGYQTEFVTTPITLGYFHAQSIGSDTVEIKWQMVTEVAHVGFNLYEREKGKGWHRLNEALILPLIPCDSFDVREYTFTAYNVKGKRFAIGDIDVTGKETIHGPFRLDQKAGADRAARKVTDWKAIKAKRKAKADTRKAK